MSVVCEVPNCERPARFSIELGCESERTEVCGRHADRLAECGGKRLRRLEVSA